MDNRKKKIMTAVVVLLLIAVVGYWALSGQQKARTAKCIINLKRLRRAKKKYVMDRIIPPNTTVDTNEINLILYSAPTCPVDGARYHYGPTGKDPVCPNYDAETHPATI